MISLIEKDNIIYIHVKMEQIYIDIRETRMEFHEREKARNFLECDSTSAHIFSWIKPYLTNHSELKAFIWTIDFEGIKRVNPNALSTLVQSLSEISVKRAVGVEGEYCEQLKRAGFSVNEGEQFGEAFKKYLFSYIKENCLLKSMSYPTGETIENYINLKPILEDKKISFLLGYLLGESINKKRSKVHGGTILFCHTLNGAFLAETISLISGMDIIYSDRLSMHRSMRRDFMPKKFYSENTCLIVSDVVCLGHELIRAKDIISMMGGTVGETIQAVKIKIKNVKAMCDNDISFLEIDRDKQEDIKYKISLNNLV